MHRLLSVFFIVLTLSLSAAPESWARHDRQPGYADAFAAMENGQTSLIQGVMARGGDPVLNKVLRGYLMARPGNDYSFDELAGFVSDNPDWPGLNGIIMIAEQKIPDGATYAQVVNWFHAHPPLTPNGFYRYMDALEATGHGKTAANMIRSRWIEKDFGSDDLQAFRSRYLPLLTTQDHHARLDRLLWKNDITAARAMYSFVSSGVQALAEARIALANQSSSAESLLDRVPTSLQRDPGLLYERLRWRRKNNNDEGAIEILLNAPDDLSHADEWWTERHIIIRRLMEQKDFALAYRLAARNGLSSGFEFVQAEFLAGWLALRFLRRADLGEQHFRKLLSDASSPISRARGEYWLGRALEAQGRKHESEKAYQNAAALNTTFYGQLAIAKLYAQPTITAAPEPAIPQHIRDRFFARDVIRATEKLYRMGLTDKARLFFKAASDAANQRVDYALLLEVAYRLQRPDWAITAAKAANQKNFIMTGAAYPVLSMKIPTPPDVAFTHALIRQESLFKADAGSPAGARGLMQLMPGTAKDVAKKLGLPYSSDRLIDPDYNVRLGTTFIQNQIDNFDGSYILALAGYNAGPRRAREWIDTYGDPRTQEVDPVDWIELIPIYETRNYVQRIIENLQFYRARLNGRQAPLMIMQDIKR